MNQDSPSPGELARPADSPAAALAAAPSEVARLVPASPPAVSKPSGASTISAAALYRAFRRRQTLALGVAILVTAIAGPTAWFLVPPAKFRAQARLLVAAQTPRIIFPTLDNSGGEESRDQTTQMTLVKSQVVLEKALDDDKVKNARMVLDQPDARAWLQEALQVGFVGGSQVMEIALSGDNPYEIADVVNAVKKAYIDESIDTKTRQRVERFEQLKKIKEEYKNTLQEYRNRLRKVAETAGSNDPTALAVRQQIVVETQEELRHQLLEIASKKRLLEAQLQTRVQPEAPAEPAAPPAAEEDLERLVDQLVEQDPQVADLRAELADAQTKLKGHRQYLFRTTRKGDAASSRPLRDRVEMAMAQLESARKAARPLARQRLEQQGPGQGVAQADGLEQQLAVLKVMEQGLQKDLEKTSKGSLDLTHNSLDLQALQEEISQVEQKARGVASEVEAMTIEVRAPSGIRVIEHAQPPVTRDQKKRYMTILLIACGTFFGCLFGVAFLELQSQKVDTADDVPTELGLQVVGALPILPAQAHRRGGIARRQEEKDRYWRNLLLESVDATRTMLVHAARTGSHRVVLISSAVGGEGKTSLASYLATSLARSGLNTVLIDADLRSPSIHRLFDLGVAPGLSEVLRGEVHLGDAIAETAVEGLKIVPAGHADRQTIRILAQGGLGPYFAQIKEQFDFVIVDSSPILPVADASIIAQQVDAVLFSIFRDKSRKTKVFAALQRLQCLGVPVLGAVVTGAGGGAYGNGYGYGYGYGESRYTYATLPESAADSSGAIA
jgi:capsular exopolysaccharide synthesis family protein